MRTASGAYIKKDEFHDVLDNPILPYTIPSKRKTNIWGKIKQFFGWDYVEFFPIKIIKVNGKKYIYVKIDSIQCAFCLYVQEVNHSRIIKNKEGMVIGLELWEDQHKEYCVQK